MIAVKRKNEQVKLNENKWKLERTVTECNKTQEEKRSAYVEREINK